MLIQGKSIQFVLVPNGCISIWLVPKKKCAKRGLPSLPTGSNIKGKSKVTAYEPEGPSGRRLSPVSVA